MKHDFDDRTGRIPPMSDSPADTRPRKVASFRIDAAMDVIVVPRDPQRR